MFEPRGPLPSEIYRRRRIAAAAVVVAVVVIIAVLIYLAFRNSDETSTADEPVPAPQTSGAAPYPPETATSGEPKPTTSESETPAETQASQGACAPEAIAVVAEVPTVDVTAGTDAELRLRLTNAGTTACDAEVGASAQRYEVYRLADNQLVWSSAYCEAAQGEETEVLQPGQSVAYQVSWAGLRPNSEAGCAAADTPSVDRGAYFLHVILGDKVSNPTPFNVI